MNILEVLTASLAKDVPVSETEGDSEIEFSLDVLPQILPLEGADIPQPRSAAISDVLTMVQDLGAQLIQKTEVSAPEDVQPRDDITVPIEGLQVLAPLTSIPKAPEISDTQPISKKAKRAAQTPIRDVLPTIKHEIQTVARSQNPIETVKDNAPPMLIPAPILENDIKGRAPPAKDHDAPPPRDIKVVPDAAPTRAKPAIIPAPKTVENIPTRPLMDIQVANALSQASFAEISDSTLMVQPTVGAVSTSAAMPMLQEVLQTTRTPPQRIINQISVAVTNTSEGKFELRLDPPELGRIHISITQVDANISAHITAEKPDMAEFLRRNADILARELAKSGLEGAALSFADHQNQTDNPESEPEWEQFIATEIAQDQNDSALPSAVHNLNGSLDIRL
ncbi:MAG: flagellar hook-length control protein FliK [Paracoccaceae bacterium]